MHRHCGHAPIGVAELLVRAALADLPKTQPLELRHDSRHDGLDADEFGLKLRFAILEKESDDFLQVAVELVQRLCLAVGTGKARDVTDVETSIGIALDDCREGLHGRKDTERTFKVPAA